MKQQQPPPTPAQVFHIITLRRTENQMPLIFPEGSDSLEKNQDDKWRVW